jgi:hypothetical protein
VTKPPELPQRKLCPSCGKLLIAHEGKDARPALYCPACDGPDPLHSPRAIGWTKSWLRPPKRAP